jgi:hypothetical protein
VYLGLGKGFRQSRFLLSFFKIDEEEATEDICVAHSILVLKLSNFCTVGDFLSSSFCPRAGVRQGGVLSPYLFAIYIYIDELIAKIKLRLLIKMDVCRFMEIF